MNKKTILIIIASVCIISTTAQRNYKFENFGNRSILLNGNVTGSVDDLGATFYNPARLALVEDPVFLINAKIYQLTNIKLNNITIDGSNLSTSNFDGLPSMLAGTFKIKKFKGHQFAYAYFARNRSDFSLGYNSEVNEFNNVEGKYVNTSQINNKLRENWYGVSWAKTITPNFSVGASLFFSTYKFEIGHTKQFNTIDDSNQVSNYNSGILYQQESYGLFAKVAIAWVLSKVELGLNIDIPYLEVLGKGKFKYEEFLTGFENVDDIFTYNYFDDLDAQRKFPLGISVGAGLPIRKHKLHFGASWNAKINSFSKVDIPKLESETIDVLPEIVFNEELKSIVNLGLGAEFFLSEHINLYGSFSTDFSPYIYESTSNDFNNPNQIVNFSPNYYHYGFGVNVSYKWANFILGAIYSSGGTEFEKPVNLPSNTSSSIGDTISNAQVNRWRFVIGVEILFMGKTFDKYGIDNRLF